MRLEVGRIGKPHGVRGELVVRLTTNRAERLAVGSRLHAGNQELVVISARPHQERHIVRFAGVDDRNAAGDLSGTVLTAEPLADDGEVWVHELIGSRVVEVDGTERGEVEAVEESPASDLLILDTGAVVPFTFFVEFGDGVVVVDVPSGLFEANVADVADKADNADDSEQTATDDVDGG